MEIFTSIETIVQGMYLIRQSAVFLSGIVICGRRVTWDSEPASAHPFSGCISHF